VLRTGSSGSGSRSNVNKPKLENNKDQLKLPENWLCKPHINPCRKHHDHVYIGQVPQLVHSEIKSFMARRALQKSQRAVRET